MEINPKHYGFILFYYIYKYLIENLMQNALVASQQLEDRKLYKRKLLS